MRAQCTAISHSTKTTLVKTGNGLWEERRHGDRPWKPCTSAAIAHPEQFCGPGFTKAFNMAKHPVLGRSCVGPKCRSWGRDIPQGRHGLMTLLREPKRSHNNRLISSVRHVTELACTRNRPNNQHRNSVPHGSLKDAFASFRGLPAEFFMAAELLGARCETLHQGVSCPEI